MSSKSRYLDLSHYRVIAPIGDGIFTKVYKIEYKDSQEVFAGKSFVFPISDEIKSSDTKTVLKKVCSLSTLHHQSLLKFVGLSKSNFEDEKYPTFVTEFMPNGTIRAMMNNQKLNRSPKEWDDTKKLINIYGIASGMSYLHAHKYLHQNLKPETVMMDDYLFPKIKDFGLSLLKDILSIPSRDDFKGDPTYMAPEVIDEQTYSKSSDVYSFGILAYEILTGETPDFDFDLDGLKPQFRDDLPPAYRELFEKCLSGTPEERPSFDDIVERIKSNKDFLTQNVNESEFLDYVQFVDEYAKSDPMNPLHFEDYLKEHGKNKTINKVVVLNDDDQDDEETKSQEESETSKEESEEFNEEELLTSIHATLQFTTQKHIKDELAEAMRKDHEQVEINEEEEEEKEETKKEEKKPKKHSKVENPPEETDDKPKAKRVVKSIFPSALVKKLSKKCKHLVIDACTDTEKKFIVGKYLIEGMNGFPQNVPLGLKYLHQARKENSINAKVYYIYMLIKGKGIHQNIEEAKSQIDKIKTTNDRQICALNGAIAVKENKISEARDIFEEGSILGDNESMYQFAKMLFLDKSTKRNKKESIEYLNKAALDGHQKSEDFLTAYQLLYSCKGFKNLSVDQQYFFISNVMNNYLKNHESMTIEDSIRIDHIIISPKESEKIITRNLMKSHNFQSFLLSFHDVSFETLFPSQSIKQFIDMITKVLKKRSKNIQFGLTITEFSQDLDQICKTINASYFTLDQSIKMIPEKAFFGCNSVTSISIPVSVKEIGDNAFEGCSMLKNVEIPPSCILIGKSAFKGCSSISEINIPPKVSEIGAAAFKGCSSIKQITVPESVIVIGEFAFSACTSLSQITLPNSIDKIVFSTFAECSSLVEIDIPSSVTSFGSKVFEKCTKLTKINIPAVTSIGDNVFEGCSSLTTIVLPHSLKKMGDNIFKECTSLSNIKIPTSLKKIPNSLFLGCTSLTDVSFHKSVTKIGNNVFKNCTSLSHIKLPSNLTSIGESVFEGCTALTDVKLPKSLIKVSKSTFLGCSSLSEINLPTSINEIDDSVFKDCILLPQITIPNSVTKIGDKVFSGCVKLTNVNFPPTLVDIGVSCFEKCSAMKEITIPSSVESIGGFGFFQCTSLSKITFEEPTVIDQIRMSCFEGCTSLSHISIPPTVAKIGESAFNGCTSLSEVSFPKSVRYIESNAFNNCTSISEVSFEPQLKGISDDAFKGCTALTQVTIPSNLTNVSKIAFPPKIKVKIGK